MRLTAQQRRDRALSEADFREEVDALAEILGWKWMTVGPLRTSHGWRTATRGPLGAGWPDSVLIRARDRRMVFFELKRELGKVSPEQAYVHTFLRSAGLEVFVLRPSDFERIAEILR